MTTGNGASATPRPGSPTGNGGLGNLTLIQLTLAVAVMLHHAIRLGSGEPVFALHVFFGGEGANLGTFSVNAFFVLSGYMLYRSAEKDDGGIGSFCGYSAKRLSRIFPGVLLSTLMAIFVIGPIFTTQKLSWYFESQGTWTYLQNLLLFVRPPTALPGVFDGNLFPSVVNGVSWMIPWLMWCYVLFGVALLLKMHGNAWLVGMLTMAALYGAEMAHDISPTAMFCGIFVHTGLGPVAHFVIGWALCLFRDRIRFDWRVALALFATLPLWFRSDASALMGVLILGYGVCTFCFFTGELPIVGRLPRIHFEIFLTGFMVQQGFVSLHGGKMGHWLNFSESLAVTIPLAFAMHAAVVPLSQWIRGRLLALVARTSGARNGPA